MRLTSRNTESCLREWLQGRVGLISYSQVLNFEITDLEVHPPPPHTHTPNTNISGKVRYMLQNINVDPISKIMDPTLFSMMFTVIVKYIFLPRFATKHSISIQYK